jgi:hypothetical protein
MRKRAGVFRACRPADYFNGATDNQRRTEMGFQTDSNSAALLREREGVWVEYLEGELLIARIGNPANRLAFAKFRQPYKRQIDKGNLPDEQMAQIIAKTYAESILLDWRGFKNEDGSELAHSTELAVKALTNDLDLRSFVESCAQESALFRQEEVQATAKKSPKASAG